MFKPGPFYMGDGILGLYVFTSMNLPSLLQLIVRLGQPM